MALAKALQVNRRLQKLMWDDNGTTGIGFAAMRQAMERNQVLHDLYFSLSISLSLYIFVWSILTRAQTLWQAPLPINDFMAAVRAAPSNEARASLQRLLLDLESAIFRNKVPTSV